MQQRRSQDGVRVGILCHHFAVGDGFVESPPDVCSVRALLVVTPLVPHKLSDEHASGHANCQAAQVEQAESWVVQEVTASEFDVGVQHDRRVLRECCFPHYWTF